MKPSSKKRKTETSTNYEPKPASEGNMDPFHGSRKLLDVANLVLQHLSGVELISATEVSTGWCTIIEGSKQFYGKIKLSVNRKTTTGVERQSKRKPKRFIFGPPKIRKKTENLQVLLGSQRKYVNAKITLLIFESIGLRNEILTKFAGSLVNLELDSLPYPWELPEVTFPKLQSLIAGTTWYPAIPPRLSAPVCPRVRYASEIIELLKLAPCVETLTIYQCCFHDFPPLPAAVDRKLFDKIMEVSKNLKELRSEKFELERFSTLEESYALSKGVNFIPLTRNGHVTRNSSNDSGHSSGGTDDYRSELILNYLLGIK